MIGGWFVTGTDTEVGKTAVSEALVRALAHRGLRVAGMKPVASGCRRTAEGLRNDDVERLARASAVPVGYDEINVYSFEPAIAPHVAAEQAGVRMELEPIANAFQRLAGRADWLVVEGAGGWDVPLNRTHLLSDAARALALPVLLVVGIRLGCINHALLTARAIHADGLALGGWIANGVDPQFTTAPDTIRTLEERLGAPCLSQIPYGAAPSWAFHGEAIAARLLGGAVA